MIAIDTDPGIDDAVALAVAARSPELSLQLVSTAAGNVPVELASANALALLRRLGRDDVPVAAGAPRGLVHTKPRHDAIHGANGLGGATLPAGRRAPGAASATRALATLLADVPEGSVTIVAIAPLTNIALLLGAEPVLAARVARLVIMGGSADQGNVTPHAEYNAWADPEAAARVLEAGELDICLVPLTVTRRATLDPATISALRSGSSLGRKLSAMIDGYADARLVTERALHDLVTVAAVLDPSLIATRPASVTVDTGSGPRRGATEIRWHTVAPRPGIRPVQVAVDLDVARLRELLLARIGDD